MMISEILENFECFYDCLCVHQVLRGVQGGEGHEDLQTQQGDRETCQRSPGVC